MSESESSQCHVADVAAGPMHIHGSMCISTLAGVLALLEHARAIVVRPLSLYLLEDTRRHLQTFTFDWVLYPTLEFLVLHHGKLQPRSVRQRAHLVCGGKPLQRPDAGDRLRLLVAPRSPYP